MSDLKPKCPQIFLRHFEEIVKLKKNGFTEKEFAEMRLRQKFEISTFNFIRYIFEHKKSSELLGARMLGQITLSNESDHIITCNILVPHYTQTLKSFTEGNLNFHFRFIKKLDYFYSKFNKTPIPIILTPLDEITSVINFNSSCLDSFHCDHESIYVLRQRDYEIIIMEPYVALHFGLEEVISKIIQDERISTFYLAFVYTT